MKINTSASASQEPPSALTAILSVTTDPSPLVVTLLDQSMSVTARGVSPARFAVKPGLYMVTASLPGQDDFRMMCWAVADAERSVHLSASGPTLLNRFTGFTSQIGDEYVRKLKRPELVTDVSVPPSESAAAIPFSIRFMRLYDWNRASVVTGPKFSSTAEGTRVLLDITNPETGVIIAQLRGGGPVRNIALPPAAPNRPARFWLVVENSADDLVVRVRLSSAWADSALQYMVQGYMDQAKLIVSGDRGSGAASSIVADTNEDIAAGLVLRYLGLRLADPAIFNASATASLSLADGLILTAELAARAGQYRSAALALLRIAPGSLPLITEGFSLLLQRLRSLTNLDNQGISEDQQLSQEIRAQLQQMASLFGRWGAFIDLASPTVVFPGSDPVRPSRRIQNPGPGLLGGSGWANVGESIFSSVKGVFKMSEGSSTAVGTVAWPELGPLSTGTGSGFPVGLTNDIEEFVEQVQHNYRFNSRADTVLNVAGIILSVGIVAAGSYQMSRLSTILGALVAAMVTAQRAFPFNQRWQFYRTLLSQGQNLMTKARTGSITPEEAVAALSTLRLDFAQQIPRGSITAPETKPDHPEAETKSSAAGNP